MPCLQDSRLRSGDTYEPRLSRTNLSKAVHYFVVSLEHILEKRGKDGPEVWLSKTSHSFGFQDLTLRHRRVSSSLS